jgi:hypothetical protein
MDHAILHGKPFGTFNIYLASVGVINSRGYLFIKPGFEPGLELRLKPGLDSELEPKMTSGDFEGWKFTDRVLTFN